MFWDSRSTHTGHTGEMRAHMIARFYKRIHDKKTTIYQAHPDLHSSRRTESRLKETAQSKMNVVAFQFLQFLSFRGAQNDDFQPLLIILSNNTSERQPIEAVILPITPPFVFKPNNTHHFLS